MLTSMLLSQEQNYEGDVDDFVLQISRHRKLDQFTYCDFVDIYNSLVDRSKLQQAMSNPRCPTHWCSWYTTSKHLLCIESRTSRGPVGVALGSTSRTEDFL